jgi:hypothetical protein
MIRNSVKRSSGQIMLKQEANMTMAFQPDLA